MSIDNIKQPAWYLSAMLGSGLYLSAVSPLSQAADTGASNELPSITVTATRTDKQLIDVPAAVSVIELNDIQTGRQQLGLDEFLNRVPGLFFQNRYNFTQDLRVAIRGFGARANFGIRGIRVYADDIPATLADGQSGVDDIDIGSAQRVEVIRGPSSSLYGASAGGVISLTTEDGPEQPFIEAKVTVGEYDHQKYQLKAGGQKDRLNYLVNASHMTMDGYRDNSEVEHSLVNTKFRYDIDESSSLTIIFNAVDSPTANDAGGITEAQVDADRRQAQQRNLSSNAGEELEQQKLGFVYKKIFNDNHEIKLRNYYLWRDFQTFLPIGTHIPFVADDGVVEFDRFFYGGGGQYIYTGNLFGRPNRFTAGFDIDIQEDDRQRFLNNSGVKGILSFNQLEEAESYGFYFRNELAISDSLEFTFGGRYDTIDLTVSDRFLANGDQSSELDFEEFSPTVGLLWQPVDSMSLYFNYASSFETPTFTELANPARNLNVNLGGFNNINAQTADSFEIGARGVLADRIYYDLAAYTIEVDDEITSISNIGNRSFFENADTDRQGFEATGIVDLMEGLRLTLSYTYSDFTFDRFASSPANEGNHLPGIPENQFYAELSYQHDAGFYLVWDILHVDGLYANNSNAVKTDSYQVSNLRLGHEFLVSNWSFSPYIGINNLFDEEYIDNIRLNGFGGRLFEPAPDLNIYGGMSIRYTF